jgi:hypothetical protein
MLDKDAGHVLKSFEPCSLHPGMPANENVPPVH